MLPQRLLLPCAKCGEVRPFIGKDAATLAVGSMCPKCGGSYVTRPCPDPKTTPTSERPTLTAEELIVSERILRVAFDQEEPNGKRI